MVNSNDKKFFIPVIVALIASLLTISVGFASLSTTLSINGSAAFAPVDLVRITSITLNNNNNAIENSKSYSLNKMNYLIELSNIDSSISYDVTIKNFGQVDKSFSRLKNDLYSNDGITYDIEGLTSGDILRSKEEITFKITFRFKGNVQNHNFNTLNTKIALIFEDYHDVPSSYTIVFNSNGGTGTMNNIQVQKNEIIDLPVNAFSKENYYFKGWNTSADGTGTFYRNGQTVKNVSEGDEIVRLYAMWTETIETVYYPDECIFNGPNSIVVGSCNSSGESIDYVNTHITPFSEENINKNFMLKFTIESVDETRFSANERDTVFNILYEASDKIKGNYPGTLLRIEGNRWMLQGGNGIGSSTKVYFNKNDLIGKEIKIIRIKQGSNTYLYYSIDNDTPVRLRDVTTMYAPFDTPLTFGANILIDNTTPERHSYISLEDVSFNYFDDSVTLENLVHDNPIDDPIDEPNSGYMLAGPCIFNGTSNITGDSCTAFHSSSFINTNISLLSSANYQKDFDISFDIDEYSSNQEVNQATIFNEFLEVSPKGYGFLLRRNNAKLHLIIRDGNGLELMKELPANISKFRIVKKNNKICYSTNGGDLQFGLDYTAFNKTFNVPLTIGGSIDQNGQPFRFIKGTLSNINIVYGKLDDTVVCRSNN